MPEYHALVDAVPGRQEDVERALRALPNLIGITQCREKSHDFLIKFDAPSAASVDDYVQTLVRPAAGVATVVLVTDWADHGSEAHEARDRLS